MSARSSTHDACGRASEEALTEALALFNLAPPVHPDDLRRRYRELLAAWHPRRCATLANNPARYMHMYKKGEAMTNNVKAAYTVLKEWSAHHGHLPSPPRRPAAGPMGATGPNG